ncbi:MAG: ABC transporter ATP-binding protein [Defluviitaleaceae bacterium]|nr:ABC transporter ATP-binding protein [Defluviitaleaceae bacterium]
MIELKGVTKQYGKQSAINQLSLDIHQNGVYCLLGRNGAGKTTLMKLLAGRIPVTEGQITVDGKKVSPSKMPEEVTYIESSTSQFNLKISALIDISAELQSNFDREFAKEMAARFELDLNKKFGKLSQGMKTMLSTILALSSHSKVVLLDEPTMGFDAIMRHHFNALLMESYQAHPRIIIVSTHLIDEIAKVTERLIIIDKGRNLLETNMEDIDEKAYTITGPANAVAPLIEGLNCIGKTYAGSILAAHIYDENIETLPEGVTITRLGLQDFFINIVGGITDE